MDSLLSGFNAISGLILYWVTGTFYESNNAKKLVEQYHNDPQNTTVNDGQVHYAVVYDNTLFCPKVSCKIYRFDGKYVTASEYAKQQLGQGVHDSNVKLMETMDAELKTLIKGETVPNCSYAKNVTTWVFPSVLPGGRQIHKFKYTPELGIQFDGIQILAFGQYM